MLTAGDLDMGHARALLSLDKAHQITCAHEIVGRKLSVREAEKLVTRQHDQTQPGTPDRQPPAKSRDVQRLETLLSDLLTASVEIRVKKHTRRGEQGEVAIAFASLDELSGLLDRLGATER
jgi:ParB family chromosome partitioning protein